MNFREMAANLWRWGDSAVSSGVLDLRGDESEVPAVTYDSVRSLDAVHACVRNLANTIASLDIQVERVSRDDRDRPVREPVPESHWLQVLLGREPNDWQTAQDYWRDVVWHVALLGNHYSRITWGSDRRATSLQPIFPDRVEPKIEAGQLVYLVDTKPVPAREILHIRGDGGGDGLVGRSPLKDHAETFALALAVRQHAISTMTQPIPALMLLTDEDFGDDPETQQRLEKQWQADFSGPAGRKKVRFLEYGIKPMQLSRPTVDSQFRELEDAVMLKICRIFRTPPHKVAIEYQGPLRNLEQQDRQFEKDAVVPLVAGFQAAVGRALIGEVAGRRGLQARWLTKRIARGDLRTQHEIARIGILSGFRSPNDVLADMDENGIGPAGDVYLQPSSSIPLGEQQSEPEPDSDQEES